MDSTSCSKLISPSRPSFHCPPIIRGIPPERPMAYMSGQIAFSWARMSSAMSRACRSTLPSIDPIRLAMRPRLTLCGTTAGIMPIRFGYTGESCCHGVIQGRSLLIRRSSHTGPMMPNTVCSRSYHSTHSHSSRKSSLWIGPPFSWRDDG